MTVPMPTVGNHQLQSPQDLLVLYVVAMKTPSVLVCGRATPVHCGCNKSFATAPPTTSTFGVRSATAASKDLRYSRCSSRGGGGSRWENLFGPAATVFRRVVEIRRTGAQAALAMAFAPAELASAVGRAGRAASWMCGGRCKHGVRTAAAAVVGSDSRRRLRCRSCRHRQPQSSDARR